MLDSSRDVLFVSAKRTAFGAFGGAFKDLRATDLGAHAAQAALLQAGSAPEEIDEVFSCDVVRTTPEDIAPVEARGRTGSVQEIERDEHARPQTTLDGLGEALARARLRLDDLDLSDLLYELRRRKSRYGVGAACIGGGQGIAVTVESLL
ncbi:MAG TPA: hypothetical protein VFH68_17400 [Polyangia bacterium]|nr:hypothetical protein [Polyangia bacterium]